MGVAVQGMQDWNRILDLVVLELIGLELAVLRQVEVVMVARFGWRGQVSVPRNLGFLTGFRFYRWGTSGY